MKRQRSLDTDYMYTGGLKFVRWDYSAKNRAELTVRRGDEVEIIKPGSKDVAFRVRFDGRVGYLPGKCFYSRTKVNFPYETEMEGDISVLRGDIIGIIENSPDGKMCKIMKGTEEGNIPKYCLYRHFEAYADHTKENDEELDIRKGEVVGLVEVGVFDVNWEVYFDGKTGLVPSKCFEPPSIVHWEYEGKREDEIHVKRGDTVTMVDHHRPNTEGTKRVKVRLGEKIGYILKRCFEDPAHVYWNHQATNKSELTVKKGDIVGRVEIAVDETSPPEGYLKVRLTNKTANKTGFIPKRCLEIPAKVIKDYTATKPNELTVKEGNDVRIIHATAYIQVRLGETVGEVPFGYISTNANEILRMLEKKNDSDHDVLQLPQDQGQGGDKTEQDRSYNDQSDGKHKNVDEKALDTPLALSSKEDGVYYLQEIEKDMIGEIGIALGLSFTTLNSLSPEKFKEGVVEAWLQKKDKVENKSGVPTWKSLGGVLKKMGLTNAAKKISKDNTRFKMAELANFCWNVGGEKEKFKVIEDACNKYSEIGLYIGMPHTKIKAIEGEHAANAKRFEAVLYHWIENGGNKEYPATWMGLRKVLEDSQLSALSEKIKIGMQFMEL